MYIYIHILICMCMLEWNVRIMYTILWFNGSNLLFETISEMMFHPFYLLALLKKWTTQSPLSSYLRVHPANCIWWATLIVSLHILWLTRIRIYHWLRVVVANELLHWKTPTPYQCHPPPAIRFCWPPATCEWWSSIYSIRFSVSLRSTSTILKPFAARSVWELSTLLRILSMWETRLITAEDWSPPTSNRCTSQILSV